MRMMQGLASGDANVTRRLIIPRCSEIDGRYIEYLLLPQVVTVLYSQVYNKRREYPLFWCQYTKRPLGYGQNISAWGV